MLIDNASVTSALDGIIASVDDMGGTLGAIFGIFLAALSTSIQQQSSTISSCSTKTPSLNGVLAKGVTEALNGLKFHTGQFSLRHPYCFHVAGKSSASTDQYILLSTGARCGDRTVMDVLIPFCETYGSTANFFAGVQEAERAAKGTGGMKARFGRATYVDNKDGSEGIPDPGAWAVMEMVKGMFEGMQ